MDREIKFRVWDAERSEMYHVEEMMWNSPSPKEGWNPKYIRPRTKNGKVVRFSPPYGDDVVLMQYTGLKDKNGKEIYEGDIVKVNGELMEVFFKDGYFGWGKEHSGAYSFDPFGAEQLEVIGNIYENPNLIEDNK